jgi:hypothetical protein
MKTQIIQENCMDPSKNQENYIDLSKNHENSNNPRKLYGLTLKIHESMKTSDSQENSKN